VHRDAQIMRRNICITTRGLYTAVPWSTYADSV
jgi:hypothetical protein